MPALVSVIIPTYNRRAHVSEAIDSVLSQTYQEVEVIVVDDGSTDGTGEFIRKRYQHDHRVRYVWQENAERARARNRGMEEAKGDFMAFLDSDDLWLSDKLASQMPCFRDVKIGVSYTGCRIETINSGKSSPFLREPQDGETTGDIFENLIYMNVLGGAFSQVVRRDLISKVGGFDVDPSLIPFAEDWEYWIRLCAHTQVDYVPAPLVVHRVHGQNTEQPVGPRIYGIVISKVLAYSGRKDYARIIRAARRRYRLMGAEASHVGNWRGYMSAYFWALKVTGSGFAWEDVRTLIWRLSSGPARLKKTKESPQRSAPPTLGM